MLAAVTVLIMAMGSTLIWLLRGETQSIAAHESFNRVDIIRDVLHSNLRSGRAIPSPAVNATVTYPADGGTARGNCYTLGPQFERTRWAGLQSESGPHRTGFGGKRVVASRKILRQNLTRTRSRDNLVT